MCGGQYFVTCSIGVVCTRERGTQLCARESVGTQLVCMREKKQYTSLHSEDQESSRTIPSVGEAVHSVLVSLEGMHHGTHAHIVHLQNHNTHTYTHTYIQYTE